MNTTETKGILAEVKQSLDRVLLRDRSNLNSLMRKVRQRIHDNKPADQLAGKLKDLHFQALADLYDFTALGCSPNSSMKHLEK